ncbi:MAG: DUF1837 domain-containing protein [Labilibaculum sp.]|nr:Hachiman antiphage defense system protein HamA [Labilibaculum sp.]MBI9060257.1 DUF1837 domain-containing protein [Labilibaculum sp.]
MNIAYTDQSMKVEFILLSLENNSFARRIIMVQNSEQDALIGKHPSCDDEVFHIWLNCKDTDCKSNKKHRALSEKDGKRDSIISEVADWLINYHMSGRKYEQLKNKKRILEKYDFKDFAEQLHIFPYADKTRKGNLAEVILSEYLQVTSGVQVLIYKLRYNPNIDQSMKGDDVLLVNEKRILIGESKYRGTSNKQVVENVSQNFADHLTLPISLSFIADRLFEEKKFESAALVSKIEEELPLNGFDIVNVGFILSDFSASRSVEKNMDSNNPKFLMLTLNIENPFEFMEQAFDLAQKRLEGDFEYDL